MRVRPANSIAERSRNIRTTSEHCDVLSFCAVQMCTLTYLLNISDMSNTKIQTRCRVVQTRILRLSAEMEKCAYIVEYSKRVHYTKFVNVC